MGRQVLLQPVGLTELQFVPAHVGYFELRLEGHDFAGKEAQALVFPAFVIGFKEGVHTEADAHKEFSRPYLFGQKGDEVEFLQIGHGVADGTDTGKFHQCGVADDRRIAGDNRILAKAAPGVVYVGQIADFIINDGYFHLITPLW